MRKNVWLAILLVSVLGLVAQADVTTAVVSSADTGIRSATVNYGSDLYMYIFGNGATSYMGYVRFDLSSLSISTVVSASLKMTVSGGAPRNDSLVVARYAPHGLNNIAGNTIQSWDEATLNQSNTGAEVNWTTGTLDTTKVTDLDGDVTGITETFVSGAGGAWARGGTFTTTGSPLVSFLQSRVDNDGLITFIIRQEAGGGKGYGLVTREEATDLTYRPELTLTYIPGGAGNPQPANDATVNKDLLSQLSWTLNNPDIGKCDVYLGTEPNVLTMDKLTFTPAVESVNIDDFTNFSASLAEGTYYWRVDCYKGSPLPTEPNLPGQFWKFTATAVPVINQQPADQIKNAGETAEFTVAASSSSTMTYAWYRSPDNVNNTPGDDVAVGTNSPTLTLAGLTGTNEGYYYCKATNTGGSSYSNTANLGVKRNVAHWTLDGLVSELYADSSGEGHNADPNGTPSFVAGAGAITGNGVVIDTNNGYASAGTWNPSLHTGEFTFSLWAKWAGQTAPTSWQGLIAKENSFGAATMMWQLEADMNNNNLALKSGTSTLTSTPLPIDTWIHLTVVFNGTTATIYRNGVSSVSGAFTQGTKTDAPVLLGASSMDTATGLFYTTFNGVLDDVHIYNYALTWNQVIDLYHTVSGQSICTNKPTYDYTGDCLVTVADFATFATQWLNCGLYPDCP